MSTGDHYPSVRICCCALAGPACMGCVSNQSGFVFDWTGNQKLGPIPDVSRDVPVWMENFTPWLKREPIYSGPQFGGQEPVYFDDGEGI